MSDIPEAGTRAPALGGREAPGQAASLAGRKRTKGAFSGRLCPPRPAAELPFKGRQQQRRQNKGLQPLLERTERQPVFTHQTQTHSLGSDGIQSLAFSHGAAGPESERRTRTSLPVLGAPAPSSSVVGHPGTSSSSHVARVPRLRDHRALRGRPRGPARGMSRRQLSRVPSSALPGIQ